MEKHSAQPKELANHLILLSVTFVEDFSDVPLITATSSTNTITVAESVPGTKRRLCVLVAESATMQLEFVNAQRILKQATAWGQQELGENAAFQRVRSQHVLEKYPVVAMAFAQGILPMYASAVMGGWEQTAHLGVSLRTCMVRCPYGDRYGA